MNQETFNSVVQLLGYVIAAATAIISIYKSYKEKKTVAETITILINTLKDEEKLTGGQFHLETLKKAEKIAIEIGANDVAVEQVKDALKGRELDFKLASWKGKPVYISDVFRVGLGISAIQKALKK